MIAVLLAVASTSVSVPAPALSALRQLAPSSQVTVTALEYREAVSPDCRTETATALGRPDSGGRVSLKLSGHRSQGVVCEGIATARVQYSGVVWVAQKVIPQGSLLTSGLEQVERIIPAQADPLFDIPANPRVRQTLPAGTIIEKRHLQDDSPAIGQPVTVVVVSGAITLRQTGRATPCSQGRGCATLPSGKRVEGRWSEGLLLVETP